MQRNWPHRGPEADGMGTDRYGDEGVELREAKEDHGGEDRAIVFRHVGPVSCWFRVISLWWRYNSFTDIVNAGISFIYPQWMTSSHFFNDSHFFSFQKQTDFRFIILLCDKDILFLQN